MAGLWAGAAEAKTPGATYCFHGICHRVATIAETQSMVGRTEQLITSFYDHCSKDRLNPCGLTSSGERFRPDRPDNAASPIYPDGTTLLVHNPATKSSAIVRVNNAGPYHGRRKLDLSRGAAEKLGFRGKGVAKLDVRVLAAPTAAQARYVRGRTYEPVQGYIGQFASLDDAYRGTAVRMAFNAMATSVLAPVAAGALVSTGQERASTASRAGAKVTLKVRKAKHLAAKRTATRKAWVHNTRSTGARKVRLARS